MNELTRPLSVIETEINFYKTQTATGIIEIGKRLIEAKAQLQHGEWLPWLRDKVDFTEFTAARFMRVSKEFGNLPSTANLGTGKLFALLDIPAEERQTFIEDKHTVNGNEKTVDEMTTRELQKVIAEKKILEEEKKLIEEKANQLERRLQEEQQYSEEKEEELHEKDITINKLKTKVNEGTTGIKEVIKTVETIPADYEKLKEKVKELKKEQEENMDRIVNASKLVMAMKNLDFDCNAKLLNDAVKIEQELAAKVYTMVGLYETAKGNITEVVSNRLKAMINNLNDLIKVLSTGLNLKEANVIVIENYDNL
jgi:chromosome segregation ATPase